MTTIKIYVNKYNSNKFLEVRNDGWYHNSVREFMGWSSSKVINRLGDGYLHRWRISSLKALLEDYVELESKINKDASIIQDFAFMDYRTNEDMMYLWKVEKEYNNLIFIKTSLQLDNKVV